MNEQKPAELTLLSIRFSDVIAVSRALGSLLVFEMVGVISRAVSFIRHGIAKIAWRLTQMVSMKVMRTRTKRAIMPCVVSVAMMLHCLFLTALASGSTVACPHGLLK